MNLLYVQHTGQWSSAITPATLSPAAPTGKAIPAIPSMTAWEIWRRTIRRFSGKRREKDTNINMTIWNAS